MVFSSIFKNEIKNFLEIIKSTKARNTYLHYRNSLQEFDLYLSSIEYKDKKLNREIIDCWIATIKGKPSTVQGKVVHIKYFLRYLNEIDIYAEMPDLPIFRSDYIAYQFSDDEIEKWETKIKDALLRRDSTVSSVSSAMKEIMASGFTVGGKTMYLSDFGIETLGYFNAADNEKNAYHINGDEDDESVKSKTNDLKAMISSDPNTVVVFFNQLSKTLYSKLKDLMGRTDYSSSYTVYDDKKMKEDYDSYSTKIKEAEQKLKDYEDKWYSKFSAMETALAKMQSNSSAVTSLLGG